MRKQEGKNAECMCFIDLEKAYDRGNRKALWQALRMYDVGGKLMYRKYVRCKIFLIQFNSSFPNLLIF